MPIVKTGCSCGCGSVAVAVVLADLDLVGDLVWDLVQDLDLVQPHLFEENHISFFKDILKYNKGNQDIVFNVLGNGDGLKLNLLSPKYKVKISENLLKTLQQNKFDFKLN